MREIVIKTVLKENGQHVVKLGNGTLHKFPSQKAAYRFLAETNKFLTERLFTCNHALTSVYEHYRNAWMVAPETRGIFGQREIETLEKLLHNAQSLAPMKSGNLYAFAYLSNFCYQAKAFIKTLLSLKMTSRDTITRHKLSQLFETVFRVESELNAYGQTNANELFAVNLPPLDNQRFININAA